MYEKSVIESLVIGRPLTNLTFSGKTHKGELPGLEPKKNGSIDEVINHLKSDLEKKAKGKVGLLLSGGKDSRMLAAILNEIGVDAICYTYHVFPNCAEVKVAKKVAETLGFEHRYIKLNVDKIYKQKAIDEIIKVTDGSPKFQTLLLNTTIKEKLGHDVIITGDLVTEFLDSGEYRSWKDGRNINNALYSKEIIRKIVKNEYYEKAVFDLKEIFTLSFNQLLLERKRDRIIRNHLYKKVGLNFYQPATNPDVLNAAFSLPLKERQDGKLIRKMVKRLNKKLYKLPTARSPFSLRWPLWFHMAWSKVTNRQKYGNNGVRGRYGFIDKELLMDLDYEFLDKKEIEILLDKKDRETIFRLDNLRQWENAQMSKKKVKPMSRVLNV